MTEWLDDEAWAACIAKPNDQSVIITVVYDPDMGCIASATMPDGSTATAADDTP